MVPIILGVVIQVFKLTSVHIAIRLVVYIITVLQHKGMNIFPSQNFDFSIRKVAVVTVIKQDFFIELGGTIYFGEEIHHHEPKIFVYANRLSVL